MTATTIPLTTVGELRKALVDLPDESSLTLMRASLDVAHPPEPTAVDLLRQVAEHGPYRTVGDTVQVVSAPTAGAFAVVSLPQAQLVAALNAVPHLLRLMDAYDRREPSVYANSGWSVAADIVAELRGDR